jgi:hypothetical protein
LGTLFLFILIIGIGAKLSALFVEFQANCTCNSVYSVF